MTMQIRSRRGVLMLALSFFLGVGFWGLNTVAQERPPEVTVRIPVFSGRVNPGWTFSVEDLGTLREFIRGLPPAEPVEDPLFTGFMLGADEDRCRFPGRVRVFDGVIVATTKDGVTRYFQDTKGFETFLIDEAKKRGLQEFLPAEEQEN